MDEQVSKTYARDSKATNKKALSDPYVKFFRWATDRLGDRDGIVCFVTNNSFADQAAFDGMRKHLLQDFTQIYHLDLHGNVRKNPKLSGTTHNVFGIQVGAGITVAVRKVGAEQFLKYHRVPENWRKTEKLAWLTAKDSVCGVEWQTLEPNAKHTWLTEGMQADYEDFLPLGTKDDKASKTLDVKAIFKSYGRGIATCRDDWAYDFSRNALADKVMGFIGNYNAEVDRWKKHGDKTTPVDAFVNYDDTKFKWSETLKANLMRGVHGDFDEQAVRPALYRPFCKQWLYFDRLLNERVYQMPQVFPANADGNAVINVTDIGSEKPFMILASCTIPDLHLVGAGASTQCFPLYTYALDGKIRRDNITDWALGQFRDAYGPDVTKRDIFHYVYALLHHPQYRERYKENLKRELPRIPLVGKDSRINEADAAADPSLLQQASPGTSPTIHGRADDSAPPLSDQYPQPLVPDPSPIPLSESPVRMGDGVPEGRGGGLFRAFADTGARLAALHVGYDQADEYPLTQIVNKNVPFSWRVAKMRLTEGKTAVKVNDSLTLAGIPPEAFAYKLGNRSALEWVLDQYQVTTDKRSGITSDPNRPDDPEYIARLVARVVTVSLETVKLVVALPPLDLPPTAAAK